MRIESLDHLVLTVRDVQASLTFYSEVLGMQTVEFGEGRKALVFGEQKINLHRQGGGSSPGRSGPRPDQRTCAFSPRSR